MIETATGLESINSFRYLILYCYKFRLADEFQVKSRPKYFLTLNIQYNSEFFLDMTYYVQIT